MKGVISVGRKTGFKTSPPPRTRSWNPAFLDEEEGRGCVRIFSVAQLETSLGRNDVLNVHDAELVLVEKLSQYTYRPIYLSAL